MEFDELQKIWNSQSNQTMYAIDEQALSNRITARKNIAHRTTVLSELVSIITNIVASLIVLIVIWVNQMDNIFMYLLGSWMFVNAAMATVVRLRRIYSKTRFDRSMFGELDNAISLTRYRVRFSNMMFWSSIPVSIFSILLVWDSGKTIWLAIGMTVFFLAAHVASRWEVNLYKKKLYELEQLKQRLEAM